MEWINPRDSLPKDGDVIWCLVYTGRDYVADEIPVVLKCTAVLDRYGVIQAREYSFSRPHRSRKIHFFNWENYKIQREQLLEDYLDSRQQLAHLEGCLVVAWMPFESLKLPEWGALSRQESVDIIMKLPEIIKEISKLKKRSDDWLKIKEHYLALNSATKGNTRFIAVRDRLPRDKGVFVVVNKGGTWLSQYDPDLKGTWYAPNGNPVIAWYPVPSHYSG